MSSKKLAVLCFVLLFGSSFIRAEDNSREHPTMLAEDNPREHPTMLAEEHPEESKDAEHPEKKKTSEHPEKKSSEHPEKKSSEHPEHPTKKSKGKITMKDFAKAVEKYIKKESELKGGYFLVYDKKANKPLVLELDKVHKERLSKVAKNLYFACADFKTPEGKIYDLDIFMKGQHKKHLEVTEISVHKEAGKPRYTWYEKRGVWKKKKVK